LPKFEAPTKPLFINQQKEPIIPQPPQLAKKAKAEFIKSEEVSSGIVNSKKEEKKDDAKMTYDKLFGNDSTT